jgi:hypothetical protein
MTVAGWRRRRGTTPRRGGIESRRHEVDEPGGGGVARGRSLKSRRAGIGAASPAAAAAEVVVPRGRRVLVEERIGCVVQVWTVRTGQAFSAQDIFLQNGEKRSQLSSVNYRTFFLDFIDAGRWDLLKRSQNATITFK